MKVNHQNLLIVNANHSNSLSSVFFILRQYAENTAAV